jgi:hypothetical protein
MFENGNEGSMDTATAYDYREESISVLGGAKIGENVLRLDLRKIDEWHCWNCGRSS